VIRAKIRVFARFNYMNKILRENAETVTKIKQLNQKDKLQINTILGGHDEL
jgi:hypothetical protein